MLSPQQNRRTNNHNNMHLHKCSKETTVAKSPIGRTRDAMFTASSTTETTTVAAIAPNANFMPAM
eukprot:8174320-Ditylum_brightwellii.AAC.1